MIKKYGVLIMVILSLFTLGGCSSEAVANLEAEKNEYNLKADSVKKSYESNKKAAAEVEEDILNYLKSEGTEPANIKKGNINADSSFENSLTAYKTGMMKAIDKSSAEKMLSSKGNSGITEEAAKKEAADEILNSLEIYYFIDTENEQLEQTIIYTANDGSLGMFSAVWESEKCIEANAVNAGGLAK
jgi:hypothetical protein